MEDPLPLYIPFSFFLLVAWSTLRTPLSLNMISVRAPFVPHHGASKSLSLNRGGQGPLAHLVWYLHVRMSPRVDLLTSPSSTLISSWEFVTTLNYELDIIRGRRPYPWTIWVCNGNHLTWPALTYPQSSDWFTSVDLLSYTPHLSWGGNTSLHRSKRYGPLQLPGVG